MNNIVERLVDAVLDCDSKEVNRLATLLRERIAAGDHSNSVLALQHGCADEWCDICSRRTEALVAHGAAVEACDKG